ncbi:MAG: isochorismatase family protein [Myxococcaceae bacterium]|nr:isochorismatase family protein [Myxococcaceae bacterium]
MGLLLDRKTALIVVDLQNDFADPEGSLYVPGAEQAVASINGLLRQAREAGSFVVYTLDWHPPSTPHFKEAGGTWPPHCVRDTWGAQWVKGLYRVSPAVVIHKGMGEADGYSAFSEAPGSRPFGGMQDTGLDAMLRMLGVRRVVVSGLATDYCVKHTTLDARRLQFETVVVEDAVRAVDLRPGDGAAALAQMAREGATIARAWDA